MARRRTTKSVTPRTAAAAPLVRLGTALPPPFVGREKELAALTGALAQSPLSVVTGAAGVGKTALARELLRSRPGAYVRCEEDDLPEAVIARAERALDVVPGSLARVLATEARFLVIDELHRLTVDAAAKLLDGLTGKGGGAGRILALSRDVLPLRRGDVSRAEVRLDGLRDADAHALWARLEETYGPTPRGACDAALERTRGVPLALRREYARAIEKKAWDVNAVPADERRVLAAAAVLRLPATPAALAVLAPGVTIEKAVRELVRRQLVDPCGDGRLEVHDVVRAQVIESLSAAERKSLEAGAAALLDDADEHAVVWEQIDGAALNVADPVDRLREAVRHLAAAGKHELAVKRCLDGEALLARRGGGGEALAMIAQLEAAGVSSPALRQQRARVAARLGRVADALEAYETLERDAGDKASPELRIGAALLALAAGDPAAAAARLRALVDHIQPEIRAKALCALAQVDAERGAFDAARKWLKAAADAGDKGKVSAETKARAKLLSGLVDERDGRIAAARQTLGRVTTGSALAGAGDAAAAAALAGCLAEEGRVTDAIDMLAAAERAAREQDEPALGDEVRRRRAAVDARTGKLRQAEMIFRELATAARERGDELGALRAEVELALLLVGRGRALEAGKLATAAAANAAQRGLSSLAADARLARALAELDELRVSEARDLLRSVVADGAATLRARSRAASALTRAAAWLGEPADAPKKHDTLADDVDDALVAAEVALAGGDAARALELAIDAARKAERAERRAELTHALADAARLHLARGERTQAENAATRVLAEGCDSGLDRAMARALLVRAALSRDEGNLPAARNHAADALTIARAAGLGLEKFTSAAAAELISREAGDTGSAEPLGAIRRAAAATLGETARLAADRTLTDLGLTPARPYRLITGEGAATYAAEIDATLLRLDKRSLVVDGAREHIVKHGKPIADLRRRSLLKRLLFLFAGAPGKTYTKEDIVKRVWGVEYHPLRHDAALFTNIMRLRRLLGANGEETLRVGDGGYRLCPPADFLFVDKLAQ